MLCLYTELRTSTTAVCRYTRVHGSKPGKLHLKYSPPWKPVNLHVSLGSVAQTFNIPNIRTYYCVHSWGSAVPLAHSYCTFKVNFNIVHPFCSWFLSDSFKNLSLRNFYCSWFFRCVDTPCNVVYFQLHIAAEKLQCCFEFVIGL